MDKSTPWDSHSAESTKTPGTYWYTHRKWDSHSYCSVELAKTPCTYAAESAGGARPGREGLVKDVIAIQYQFQATYIHTYIHY